MAISSGVRLALGEATSWLAAATIMVAGAVYFQEIREGAAWMLGIDPNAAPAAITQTAGDETAPSRTQPGTVEIRASANRHFHTSALLNGRPVDVMVDTGASLVALTFDDAERAGIFVRPADFTHRVSTANGTAKVAPVTIDRVQIGEITVRNVSAAVSEPGRLDVTLLGMSFLGKLSSTEIRGGTLVLRE